MPQASALPLSKTRRVGVLVFLSGELLLMSHGPMPKRIEAPTALVIASRAR